MVYTQVSATRRRTASARAAASGRLAGLACCLAGWLAIRAHASRGTACLTLLV